VQAEGTVLLKNKNNCLPLAKGTKVSAFGYGTVQTVSTSLVQFGTKPPYDHFKESMEEDGKLVLNPDLYSYYESKATKPLALRSLNEIDISDMPAAVKTTYSEYNTAIVVISRSGGEGSDLIGINGVDKYLALTDVERAMIQEAKQNCSKVIALINTSNAMELGWLEEYDIDAAIMIGAVGAPGLRAVSDIIVGKVNPSGRTVDTYAADSYSSPAYQNFGDFQYTNAEEINATINPPAGRNGAPNKNFTKYVVYKEGIYVGYKYYETRYEDTVLNQGNAKSTAGVFASQTTWDYDKEVVYPFGYGLSYTTFEEKLVGVKENQNDFEVSVEVKNTGTVEGKHSVTVFAQTPYTDFDKQNNIEVSAIQFEGFGKTKSLKANESETLKITVKKDDLAHYDSFVNKTYIMEAGDYYLSIGNGAHEALNNVLAKKGVTTVNGDAEKVYKFSLSSTDTTKYSKELTTGREIKNLFDDIDLNYWKKNEITYLTRKAWDTTWPTTVTQLTATAQMIEQMDRGQKYVPGSSDPEEIAKYAPNKDTNYTIAMMRGVDFDDTSWDLILDQMSVDDFVDLVGRSGIQPSEAISYPGIFMKDGSHSVSDRSYVEKEGVFQVKFPSEIIMAASMNRDLIKRVGEAFGEANIRTKTGGHYAPSVNIHRTPYSGRNFEYFSEDGYLNGEMATQSIIGMQEKGAIPYMKHFAFNDQETNRQGVSTFMTQQAAREIYLEGFKSGVVDGKTKGLMGGFNRLGVTWNGHHKGLQTDLLRKEWGSLAISDTDAGAPGAPNTYMAFNAGIEAGQTIWASSGAVKEEIKAGCRNDAKMAEKLREAVHILLYNCVNSLGMNGISSTDKVVKVQAWWETTLTGAEIGFGVLSGLSLVGVAVFTFLQKKEA
jgi:beta-glucosidase